jgi:uncharacterized protein YegL
MVAGKKYCGACGAVPDRATMDPLAPTGASGGVICPSGHDNRAGAKFCRVCGVTLGASPPPMPTASVPPVTTAVPPVTTAVPTTATPAVRDPRPPPPPPLPGPSEFRAYEDEILPPEEQATRNLVVILIDNSGSMAEAGFSPTRTRLAELNDALRSFLTQSMHEVPQLEMNGEIAIAVFAFRRVDWLALDGRQAPGSPFHYARYIKSFTSIEPTNGTTPMNLAVQAGLQAIEQRKHSLAATGYVHESRPVMFLLTDGESSNDMTEALGVLRKAEEAKKVLFFALGVGNANDEEMRKIAPESYYSLKDQPIENCLRFVSGSLGVLSGLDDTPKAMYDAVRSANTNTNKSAEAFLQGN